MLVLSDTFEITGLFAARMSDELVSKVCVVKRELFFESLLPQR